MKDLLSPILMQHNGGQSLFISCPGCKHLHPIAIKPEGHPTGQCWDWNGDVNKPTFSPSLLCCAGYPAARCHSFIRDGNIQFLDDCYHELAGKTVPLDPIPDWWIDAEGDE